jgi:hypothetical protein
MNLSLNFERDTNLNSLLFRRKLIILLLSYRKARATHGENNDLRQLLLHSEKVKLLITYGKRKQLKIQK